MNRMKASVLIFALPVVLFTGCIQINHTKHSAVYRGRIIDAETKLPIRAARIKLDAGSSLTANTKSGANGDFKVGPVGCWWPSIVVGGPEGMVPTECKHYYLS